VDKPRALVRFEEMNAELAYVTEKIMNAEIASKKAKSEFMRLRKESKTHDERV
jgi:hypothetical protein